MKSVIKFDYTTPLAQGKPGESFFIPTLRPQIYIPVISAAAREMGREISIKCVTERYINGIRTWILK